MRNPTAMLQAGCGILHPLLELNGFRFESGDSGASSGGAFASGEYLKGERRMALHFRWSLGLVTYRYKGIEVSHKGLIRAASASDGQNAYPGFSDDPLDGFRHVRDDLERHGVVFLAGTDEELQALLIRAVQHEQERPRGLLGLP